MRKGHAILYTALAGGAVLVLVAGLWWAGIGRSPKQSSDSLKSNPSGQQEIERGQVSLLEGVLRKTDDIEKGNLMVETGTRKVYLNTIRDYNAMLDKNVNVQIEGTLESFQMIDIMLK